MKINRRHFLAGSAAALLTTPIRGSWATNEPLRSHLPLWRDIPPGGGGPSGDEVLSPDGVLKNISHPALEVFTPTNPNGWGILVAGGGGYKHIEMGDEAWPAAQWLAALGYSAYVLSYRLPGEGWGAGSLVALQDAQRALRMIRHCQQHVGVLGFSAGGHLLGMAITHAPILNLIRQWTVLMMLPPMLNTPRSSIQSSLWKSPIRTPRPIKFWWGLTLILRQRPRGRYNIS